MKPWMLDQPGIDGRVFMRGVVVTNNMNIKVLGNSLVDLDQELLKPGSTDVIQV
ncbi:hypothetical protein FM102_09955 [Corynebacterium glutamicum]|nr:hypothetical protein FM102_09955 [Corynebacterium glutamicum]